MRHSSVWFAGMSEPDRRSFSQTLDSNTILLDKLKEIVYNIVKEATEVTAADYNNPSWAFKQAHQNGVTAVCKKLQDVLTPKDSNVSA